MTQHSQRSVASNAAAFTKSSAVSQHDRNIGKPNRTSSLDQNPRISNRVAQAGDVRCPVYGSNRQLPDLRPASHPSLAVAGPLGLVLPVCKPDSAARAIRKRSYDRRPIKTVFSAKLRRPDDDECHNNSTEPRSPPAARRQFCNRRRCRSWLCQKRGKPPVPRPLPMFPRA